MRSPSERGSVSAEFALALPGAVMVLVLLLTLAIHGAAQVALEGAARAAARELARGEHVSSAEAAALRIAGEDISFGVEQEEHYVTVVVTRPVRALGWIELDAVQDARATARIEDSLLDTQGQAR